MLPTVIPYAHTYGWSITDGGIIFVWSISAARSYWDYSATAKKGFFDVKGATVPVAVSAFPDEIYTAPRSWAEKAYPKLIHYNRLPKGGHFAAWEQPRFYSEEIRASFQSLRDKA